MVPKRFSSLDDALSSESDFVIRSECDFEYLTGISGLLRSIFVYMWELKKTKEDPGFVNWDTDIISRIRPGNQEEVEELITKRKSCWNINDYCRFMETDAEEFIRGISYSYWHMLDGYNRCIIADSSVKGRYHIITEGKERFKNYTVFENGNIIMTMFNDLPSALKTCLDEVVEFYESIRTLDHFDIDNCPLVEFQTHDNQNYFLQYHRTQDFTGSEPFLEEREPETGEIKVDFIRGSTSYEGETVEVHRIGSKKGLADNSVGLHPVQMYADLQYSHSNFQFFEISDKRSKNLLYEELFLMGHRFMSGLFKPRVSVVLPYGLVRSDEKYFRFHIVSDGRKGYITRLE